MRSYLTRVHLYIEESGDHLKYIVHKSETMQKEVKHLIKSRRAKIGIICFQ